MVNFLKNKLKKYKLFRIINYKLNSNYIQFKQFNNLKKDSIFIDLGAHIGNISQYVDDKFGCNIYCYEPNPYAFNKLSQRFLNCQNINCSRLAVTASTQNNRLYFTKHLNEYKKNTESLEMSLEKKKTNIDESNFIDIDVIHIDTLIKKFNKIDIIKINIEGHEYKILPSIINNRHKIKKVICQLHGMHKNCIHLLNDHNQLINQLKELDLYNKWFFELNY